MCNMFKDQNLVAEALSRNPEECREIFVYCVFGKVSGLQAKLSETSMHLPFCIWSRWAVAVPSVIFFPGKIKDFQVFVGMWVFGINVGISHVVILQELTGHSLTLWLKVTKLTWLDSTWSRFEMKAKELSSHRIKHVTVFTIFNL